MSGTPVPANAAGRHRGSVVGRADEVRAITSLIEHATTGERGGVLFTGEGGIGKTFLLDLACEYAAEAGFRVVKVRPPSSVTLGLGRLADDIATALGREPVGEGATVALALSAQLTGSAIESRLLVAVDDLHLLAPEAVSGLIDAVALTEGGIALIAAARGALGTSLEPRGDLVVDQRRLGPLGIEELTRLATVILGGPVLPSVGKTLHARTWGNPLFAGEILRRWKVDGVVARSGSAWDLTVEAPPVPEHLQEALAAAVGALDEDATKVAEAMAALGRPVLFEELAHLTRLDDDTLTAALADLTRRQMLEGAPRRGYRLAHPGHESAVLSALDEATAAGLSTRILEMLRTAREEGRKVSLHEMAEHALRSLKAPGDLPQILRAAAEEAGSTGRFAEAARWFGELECVCAPGSDEHTDALIGQAKALANTQPARADQIFLRAEAALREPSADLLMARGQLMGTLGRSDDATHLYRRAVETEPSNLSARTKLANCMLLGPDKHEAIAMLEEISAAGGAEASGSLGFAAHSSGDLEGARRWLELGLTQHPTPQVRSFLKTSLAWILVESGRWDEATEAMNEAVEEATASGDHLRLWRLAAGAVRLHARRGDIIRSLDLATQTLKATTILGGPFLATSAYLALADCHLEAGAPAEALEATAQPLSSLLPQLNDASRLRVRLTLCEARISAEDRTVTEAELDEIARGLQGDLSLTLTLARLVAMRRLLDSDPAGAADAVLPHMSGESPFVFEQARLLQTAAEALWRIRRRAAARDAALRALRMFEGLGARLRQAQVAAWLFERFNGTGNGAHPDPHGLTEREREILSLAAEGLTNAEIGKRLFISPGTVKKHIENILGKTGARRRSDLHRFLLTGGTRPASGS